ncbi:hypothetical protein, partial [Sansalvadorimonas verongulae]|uniref:hypothetical protein n=1 Tax=Sansalvadorimonas verongulae TaxID=2172824 RepID=UPI001E499E90
MSLIFPIVLGAFMSDEMTGFVERVVAPVMVTDIGPVPCPCVNVLVFGEIASCGKRFVAPVL